MRAQYQGWVIFAVFAACLLAPRGLSFLPFIPALIAFAAISWDQRKPLAIDKRLAALLSGIALLGFASVFWADYPDEVSKRMLNTGGIFLGGLLLLATVSKISLTGKSGFAALFGFYILYGLYLAFEYKSHFAITSIILNKHIDLWNFNRSFVVYCVAFIPMFFLAGKICDQKKHIYALRSLLIVALFLPLMLTQSQTAQLVAIVALLSYAAIRLMTSPRKRRALFMLSGIGISVAILLSPTIPALLTNMDGSHTQQSSLLVEANMSGRIEIWNFVAERIHERPLAGHGIEATKKFVSPEMLPYNKTTSFLHPHNSYLQIWTELGLAGAIMACLLIVLTIRVITFSDFAHQPLYFAVFAAVIALLATGYGLWQSWHLGLIFTGAAFAKIVTRVHQSAKSVV